MLFYYDRDWHFFLTEDAVREGMTEINEDNIADGLDPQTYEEFADYMVGDGWWDKIEGDYDIRKLSQEPEYCPWWDEDYFTWFGIYPHYYNEETDKFLTVNDLYKDYLKSNAASFAEYLKSLTTTYGIYYIMGDH